MRENNSYMPSVFLANRRNYKDYSETPTKGPSMLKKLIRAFQHSIVKRNTADDDLMDLVNALYHFPVKK